MSQAVGKATRAEKLDVFRGAHRLGSLSRIPQGASFEYEASYVARHLGDPAKCVSFAMPVRSEAYEVHGANLHSFFAGLLPEGLRFQSLVRGLGIASDDLFGLLAAAGGDTVGDIRTLPAGSAYTPQDPLVDTHDLQEQVFIKLQIQSFEDGILADPVVIPGLQAKVSVGMVSHPLRSRSRRTESFIKIPPALFPRLAENEKFFMDVARSLKIETAQVELVHDRRGKVALWVQRFDRVQLGSDNRIALTRLHQEDACQLLGRHPAYKFDVGLAEVSECLAVCSAPLVERLKLIQRHALSYVIGNGDLHAKNISVLERDGRIQLSPLYDLHSTLPYGDGHMVMPVNERGKSLTGKDLVAFAEVCGVRKAATERMLVALAKGVGPWIERIFEIGLAARKTRQLEATIRERLAHLVG